MRRVSWEYGDLREKEMPMRAMSIVGVLALAVSWPGTSHVYGQTAATAKACGLMPTVDLEIQ
jgi:hypothetical protein